MSSTGNPELPQMKPQVLAAVFEPVPAEREAYIEHNVNLWRTLWSPGFPFDEKRLRKVLAKGYDRSYYPPGMIHQSLAVLKNGYRKSLIASIKAPTLIIHGDKDPLMSVEGGKERSQLIPGAKLLIINGMGHDMPKEVWPKIIDTIYDHTVHTSV
jgi:pimeloyl-ACP methyl ester carboxylesterase